MHLSFTALRMVRFRSFIKEAIFDFDEMGAGLYFLKGKNNDNPALGPNGAGKSSILDALLWCLYGKTVQGLRNTDIAPWSGKGVTEVEVTLYIDDVDYSIKRTANPNLLTIDGKEAGQDYVNKLIGIPFEILPFTVILGQKRPLFFDLTASEKLKLFSEALVLDRWEKRSDKAAEMANSLNSEIGTAESQLQMALNAHSQASSDFATLREQSTEWENKRAESLANAEKDRKALKKQLDATMAERDTADLRLERAETELRALNPNLTKLARAEQAAGATSNEANSNYHSLYLEEQRLKSDQETIDEGICPTCEQPLKTHKLKKDTKTRLAELKANITHAVTEAKEAEENYTKTETAYHAEIAAKQQFEKDANEARDCLDRLCPKIAGWKAEIKALDKLIQGSETDNNPYTEQLQTLRRRRDLNKASIQQAEKTIKEKTEQCERVRYWVKGFKDMKLLQVEEILQELEITTNGMCEESGLIGWQIKYDIERETKAKTIARGLNITVLSPNNKQAVKWECWSGGEAQRLRLIGTAALGSVLLNHVGVTTNLEVYDEPTIGLSREGIADLVELLAQRAKDTAKSIWVIDHHALISDRFIDVVTVIKDKGGSYIDVPGAE